jgi:hypothetical protein
MILIDVDQLTPLIGYEKPDFIQNQISTRLHKFLAFLFRKLRLRFSLEFIAG